MTTEPKTVSIEPNWDGMRDFVRNVARTDLTNALKINTELACEGVDAAELHSLAIDGMDPAKVACLADILMTAVEDGGTNTWRAVSCYRWDTEGDNPQIENRSETSVLVHEDTEDGNETAHAVGIATIEKGLKLIAEGAEGCKCNSEITGACALAIASNEPDGFDAYSADAVMQAGMFGEVIYG